MRGVLIVGAIAAGMMAPSVYGQSVFDSASFKSMSIGGIHLYGVSVFSGYSTSAYPGGLGQAPPGSGLLGADVDFGATASVGWQFHRQRTDFSLLYSGTYGGEVRYSNANAFSQSLALSFTRTLSPKWTLTFSGSGSDSTTAQFLFQPTNASLVSQVPATMDDLAAAFSLGQFTSNQIASTLTGAPVLESPARTLLLGDRVLSYSGQASLNYAYSSRLSFHLSSFTAAGQNRLGSTTTAPAQNFILPRSIGFDGGVGMSYMLSPRTQLGLNVSGNYISNRYQTGNDTNAFASIGRKMTEHWFLSVHGGGSISQFTSQTYGTPKNKNVIGGGSIGFRTYRHSLVGTYERSSTDNYGFSIGTSTILTAAWNWHRPGSRWSVFSSFSQQQVRNTGYVSLAGWEASGGVGQTLTSHVRMSAQYVYLSNTGGYLTNISNFTIQSVRVSLSWAPQTMSR